MAGFKRILVPVDFSECSRNALAKAEDVARAFEAELTVLHVWEPPLYVFPEVMVDIPGEKSQTIEQYARIRASEEMRDFIERTLSDPARGATKTRIECGHPSQGIVDVATEGAFDLIVMGTHGRRGLPHLLLGSIAEKVVRHAPCPVMTVRDHADDAPSST